MAELLKPAIIMSGIKKEYRLGAIGGRTLQADLQSWWAKKRGKEDPNTWIGMRTDLIGKKFMALDGIDLTIGQGEAVGIIGANGAGKSTLLKILSRITAPTEGEIDIYGRVTSMLEIGTGFHREMTGRENIYMNGAILGMTKEEIESRMEEIIEFSEIREFIDTPVKRYSSGMFVKLAFSVAAHLNSEIMIMDEVLAVGDMAFQQKCLDKMREAADVEGRTVLYVSHNMNTIRRLCKRVIVLDNGKIIYDGDVEHGIAVYMDHSVGENSVDIDLTKITHNNWGAEAPIEMTRLVLPDKVTAVYEPGEDLVLDLTVEVKQPMAGLEFRLTLRTDTDAGLGTAWSERFDLTDADEASSAADGAADISGASSAAGALGDAENSSDMVGGVACASGAAAAGTGADTKVAASVADRTAAPLRTLHLTMPMDMIAKGVFYASIGIYRRDEIGQARLLDHITRAFKIEVTGSPIWYTSAYGNVKLPEIKVNRDR